MSRARTHDDSGGVFTPLPVAAPAHPTANLSGWEMAWSASTSAHRESTGGSGGVPMVPAAWDPSRPFAFARRTLQMDWDRVLSLDLSAIVAQRDLSTLQSLTERLVFADLTQDDLEYFESDPLVQSAGESGKGSGVANSLHLFRLWQLTGEALLHVQGFLMRSLQAKEGAAAVVREKYAAKVEAERAANTVLKARLGAAQAELKQARATIAGYERAGARGMPVYLPQQSLPQQGTAQYPGEVFACAVCSNAFTTAQYLAQHYQRRHPEFAPHGQQQHTLPKQQSEEKEPYQPKFDAQALAALRAELTASLSAQLDAQWSRRRQEEHRRLLARLNALESLLSSQFADQTIPASMEASQRRIYEAIVREVESIKMELAREGNDFSMPPVGTPHWSIQQQQQRSRSVTPARTPKQAPLNVQVPGAAASFALDEPAAARPAPLAVMSPANSNLAYSRAVTPAASRPRTPPPPSLDPASLYHLPREDRIRAALLARDGHGSYAPFPELPWLQSRYGPQDWNPAPNVQLETLTSRVDEIAATGGEHLLLELEAEMHAQETAAESYNSCHHTVEDRCATHMPTPQWMLDADAALDARVEWLPTWEKLIEDKEARERHYATLIAAQQAELERQQTLEREEAERAAAEARALEAENQARAAALEAHVSEQDRMVAEQRRMLIQHEFTLALQQQQQQAAAVRAQAMTPTPPTSNAYAGKEGLPPLDTGASPSHASGLQRRPSQSQSQSSFIMAGERNPMGGQTIMSRSQSGASDAGALDNMRSPLSRAEGFEEQATIMPRTPNAKPSLPTLTPSMRQQQQQQQQHAQLGPSPSASFSSNGGNSSFGSSFGSEQNNNSFGGASIMHRNGSGLGGLTHISEGASIDDSSMTTMNQSRRASIEQEGKYAEVSAPASPVAAAASAPVIPRTRLDEEFEQMLSPKRVAPRTTAPPLVAGANASPQAAQRFMAPAADNTTPRAQSFAPNTTQQQTQQAPPPMQAQLSDRASQPGAFVYGPGGMAQTPGPGWTPAPAPTPQPGAAAANGHTYNIGGHGFSFPQQQQSQPQLTPSYVAASASSGIAEEVLEDSDEFPLSNDALASQADHRASIAEAQRLQAEQDRKQRETEIARREEAEAFGVPSVLHRSQNQQRQPSQQPQPQHHPSQSTLASSRGSQFNDSLEEMVLTDEPPRAQPSRPGTDAVAASRVSAVRVGEPSSVPEVTPPGGVVYQQRNLQAPPASSAAFLSSPAASRETVQPFSSSAAQSPAASINAVQAFNASPDASFAASHAYGQQQQPPQSFQQSHPAPASVSAAAAAAAASPAAVNRSTFVSDFSEDEFAPMDSIAPARTATAAAAAAPSASVPARSAQSRASASDVDEFADVLDSDDDAEIYGRHATSATSATAAANANAQTGTAVIAQGSVSNARAKLLGSGFFPSTPGGGAAASTPSMAALKAAKAARDEAEGAGSGAAAGLNAEEPTSLLSPTLGRPKPTARKATTRATRPMFTHQAHEP